MFLTTYISIPGVGEGVAWKGEGQKKEKISTSYESSFYPKLVSHRLWNVNRVHSVLQVERDNEAILLQTIKKLFVFSTSSKALYAL